MILVKSIWINGNKKPTKKTQRFDFTFWYRGEGCIERKKKMAEEEKDKNNKIMKEPLMTEEELVAIVNKQRNGNAAGVDGVRTELLKHLIKNKIIREHLLKCCNRCLEDWLRSKTTMIPKNNKPQILEHSCE